MIFRWDKELLRFIFKLCIKVKMMEDVDNITRRFRKIDFSDFIIASILHSTEK